MQNGIFKLDWTSVADAVVTAVVFAVLTALYGIVTAQGFDVFTTNWPLIGHNMINMAIVSAVVSLGKDFLTTSNGSVLGITPQN